MIFQEEDDGVECYYADEEFLEAMDEAHQVQIDRSKAILEEDEEAWMYGEDF